MVQMFLDQYIHKARHIAGSALNLLDNKIASPWSSLLINSDVASWVLDREAEGLSLICTNLGVPARIGHAAGREKACVHYMSQFALENPRQYFAGSKCRYSLAYFHGGPKEPGFTELFNNLKANKEKISKLHISNSNIENECAEAGFRPDQLAKIPIGLNLSWFDVQTSESKLKARRKLNIPQSCFVVGSFQKDGVGWGEGLLPKLIKGPDVFVDVIRRVKSNIPELHVLLTGPARGYIKNELARLNIPATHMFLKKARDVARLYHALDAYMVASRVEGGPKAVLESMASFIPCITTRVGQADDIVRHGENGWIVEPEDVDGLAEGILKVYEDMEYFSKMLPSARRSAEAEDYLAQAPRWRTLFFNGYVENLLDNE